MLLVRQRTRKYSVPPSVPLYLVRNRTDISGGGQSDLENEAALNRPVLIRQL
jgi:hypothetical protein